MNRKYLIREKEMWNNQYQEELPSMEEIKALPWSKIILKEAKKIKAKTTLETGAGSGKFSFMLADEGYEATAMDFNETILEALKRNNEKVDKKIKIVKGNILNMPFPDNSFDLVFSEGVIEHFLGCDREKAIKEMVRVSKKRIIIFVPDAQYSKNIPEGEYPFTKRELIDLCELCGMKPLYFMDNGQQIGVIGKKIYYK